ncbi:MAG: hypothetical protein KKD17_04025 [Nanoarchaeota archaeon]|nr:hypothetical protein [Nanoarchaeota archaeon]
MKKTLLFISIILATLMLVVACAPKAQQTQPAAKPAAPAPREPAATAPEESAEPEPAEAEEPEAVEEEEEPAPPAPARATTAVTQDDLDRLKSDIEGINVEDLGGLSEN